MNPPIDCIMKEDGCPNILTSYYNKYTAQCGPCTHSMEDKLKSSSLPPNLCPCCHQPSSEASLSLCPECMSSLEVDGYAESSWGSWHFDRNTGKIVCIYLDFD